MSGSSSSPELDFAAYRQCVAQLQAGKRLPNATYLHIDGIAAVGSELLGLLMHIHQVHQIDPETFNIVKFHTDEYRISFLHYPRFDTDPHPALARSTIVDLQSQQMRSQAYDSEHGNPPILHRKETFLPDGHPKIDVFAELTQAEERAGLYANRTKIGFRSQWTQLLAERGITIAGHRLILPETADDEEEGGAEVVAQVDRHRTAISRYGLSKPAQALLRHGLVHPGITYFDYGCGLGDDVRVLEAMGYTVHAWDPIFRPEGGKHHADIVNLGYVINIIEDPEERAEALRDAFGHSRQVLSVAVMLENAYEGAANCTPFGDGVLTSRNTFQKYFTQEELGEYLRTTLGCDGVAVAPGLYFVFQDPAERHAFLARRSRQSTDWLSISSRLFARKPRVQPTGRRPVAPRKDLYEQHGELLESFWDVLVDKGRMPAVEEWDGWEQLQTAGVTPRQAYNLYIKRYGEQALDQAWLERHRDLLESFWDRMAQLGRLPREDEFDRFAELAAIGLSPVKARNLFLREHGADALGDRFFELNRNLLEDFWGALIDWGRTPKRGEYPRESDLRTIGLSIARAQALFVERYGEDTLAEARAIRRDDLLVYLALAHFEGLVPFKDLGPQLQVDIRTFFGTYTQAQNEAKSLLFAVGDPEQVAQAADAISQGVLDEQALYIHRSLLDGLPPLLRVYVGCASVLYGTLEDVDIIKIHKRSRKVTFLRYEQFERRRFPALLERAKVSLRERKVEYFDYADREDRQLLYNKDLYVAEDHPLRERWAQTSRRLESLIGPIKGYGPTRTSLREALAQQGYGLDLAPLPGGG